jgi:hypothetical protein
MLLQVEARLRILEGRVLEMDSVQLTPGGPAQYDKSRGSGGLLMATPAAYSTDADLQMDTQAFVDQQEAPGGAAEAPPRKAKKVCPAI